jgi:cytochrome c peroxidase
MAFLMGFTHRPNPAVVARSSFTPLERAGAEAFRDRCERCHSAVLSADEPGSRAPFDRWEALVFSREGPIVWGSHEYKKTGVEPYVHERGARVPSLRRLFKKRPYFTNGSAKTLGDVLDRVRLGGGELYHDRAPHGAALLPLDAQEKTALLAFLELL